jgi:sulfatase modifying factor 1
MLRRHRLFFDFLVTSAAGCMVLSASVVCRANITIDTVPIGNPSNAHDPNTHDLYGAVAYGYRMGKYDVTVGQYTAFLNSVAATDTYSLYRTEMATDLAIAGIARSGVSGTYSYSVIGSPNKPITYVSWGDAARFANWLQNGQPTGSEGPGTTETGAYTLNGALTPAALNALLRNSGAKWFIPTESEWYKAAYYDPMFEHYWLAATRYNTIPVSAPPGNTPNAANYYDKSTGFAVTSALRFSVGQNYLTDVGAYTASSSAYGTFDQAGNVFQWNETLIGDSFRGLRGGTWDNYDSFLQSNARYDDDPSDESYTLGFRVATIAPEPSTAALAVMACGMMCCLKLAANLTRSAPPAPS